jgi:histidinol-phosphate/aromatic aminotransferase/cobyric acid decarboxylase-like protein
MATPKIAPPPGIEAVSKLNDLERLADEFLDRTGYAPELLSHWNPKPSFSSQIESWIALPEIPTNLVDYVYSSDICLDDRVRARLSENDDRSVLLTPSGTVSVVNACAYLKNIGTKHLVIVTPAYFAVEAVATALGMSVSFVGPSRDKNGYKLPGEIPTIKERNTATWFTFPVYGASTYFAPEDVAKVIDSLPPEMIAVVDESLAYPDRPSLRTTKTLYRILRISTPHKALSINGEKISFLTFPSHLFENLDAWSDCFSGSIGATGLRALAFIADNAFEVAVKRTRSLTRINLAKLRKLLSTKCGVSTDEDTDGYFVTLYWQSLSASLGESHAFLRDILMASGALPIPSSRNRHPPKCGLCFRVNLFRLDDAALGAASRLVDAINLYGPDRVESLA